MKEPVLVLNFDDHETRRRLMAKIGGLKGLYEVSIKPRKRTRSLNQNSYYFAAICRPFAEWLSEQWGETISTEQAHIQLKIAILGMKTKLNKETGEEMQIVPRSKTLDTHEFSEYVDKAAEFLARVAGIVVIPSDLFFEGATENPKQRLRVITKPTDTQGERNGKERNNRGASKGAGDSTRGNQGGRKGLGESIFQE
jgi:hypothetical protein